MTAMLETDIIVIRHAIEPVHPKSFRQQQLGKMEAYKTSSSGDEDFAHAMALMCDPACGQSSISGRTAIRLRQPCHP
ncbi:MAG: hypothetical protein AAGE80_06775 [Pseudomonadota bacterium]